MVLPSGDTSSDIHVPSDVSKLTSRAMRSGSESSLTLLVSTLVVSGRGGGGGCWTASNAATTTENMVSPDGRTTAWGNGLNLFAGKGTVKDAASKTARNFPGRLAPSSGAVRRLRYSALSPGAELEPGTGARSASFGYRDRSPRQQCADGRTHRRPGA